MIKNYLIIRCHGLKSNLLNDSDYKNLQSLKFSECLDFLKKKGYENINEENFEEIINKKFFERINFLLDISLNEKNNLIKFLKRLEIENIKKLIISLDSGEEMKIENIPKLSKIDFRSFNNLDKVLSFLQSYGYKKIFEFFDLYKKTKEFFFLEFYLEEKYFLEIIKTLRIKLFEKEFELKKFYYFYLAKKFNRDFRFNIARNYKELEKILDSAEEIERDEVFTKFFIEEITKEINRNSLNYSFIFGYLYFCEFEKLRLIKILNEKL